MGGLTRTLADMTPAERADCVGMWAHDGFELGVIGSIYPSGTTRLIFPGAYRTDERIQQEVAPRFDLPRAWTPSGDPVPGEWEESPFHTSIRRWCARWERKPDEVAP